MRVRRPEGSQIVEGAGAPTSTLDAKRGAPVFAKPLTYVYRTALVAALAGLLSLSIGLGPSAPRLAHAASPEAAVLDWNLYAIEALVNAPTATTPGAGQTPPVAVQHLAMVQGAVYDAVNMIDGGHQPYLAGLPETSATASRAAAATTAAHDVLVGVEVVPALSQTIIDRLDSRRDESIAAATLQDGAAAVADGIAAGQAAAAAMLEQRADDGRYGSFRFTPAASPPGAWGTTPPAFANDPFAWVARVDPFVLESTSQFRTKGPNALTSGAYTEEYTR
ncbi:MAG: hypothetical protein H0U16_06780 [Actinobacteria bacterium]|nr:hypothetical protein [Actinomycetota bacterium]